MEHCDMCGVPESERPLYRPLYEIVDPDLEPETGYQHVFHFCGRCARELGLVAPPYGEHTHA